MARLDRQSGEIGYGFAKYLRTLLRETPNAAAMACSELPRPSSYSALIL